MIANGTTNAITIGRSRNLRKALMLWTLAGVRPGTGLERESREAFDNGVSAVPNVNGALTILERDCQLRAGCKLWR